MLACGGGGTLLASPVAVSGSSYMPSLVKSWMLEATAPLRCGRAAIWSVHVPPGDTTVPGAQPDTRWNAPSPIETLSIDSGALPLFWNTTDFGADDALIG